MAIVGILVLRVSVGVVMFAHGLPKILWKREVFNKKWKSEYGFPKGTVLITGIIQVVGGLAIITGIFIQPVSLILALNMVMATYISIWNHGEPFLSTPEGKGWDVNLLLVGALITLIFLGGSNWPPIGW